MTSTPEANPTQKLAKLQVALIDFGFSDDEALEMARALKSRLLSPAQDGPSRRVLNQAEITELLGPDDIAAMDASCPDNLTASQGAQEADPAPENDEKLAEILGLRLCFSQLMGEVRIVQNSAIVPLETWNAVQKRIREPMLAGYALDEMVRLRALTASQATVTRDELVNVIAERSSDGRTQAGVIADALLSQFNITRKERP